MSRIHVSWKFLRTPAFWLPFFITLGIVGYVIYRFSDFELTMNSLGPQIAYLGLGINISLLCLIPLFFGLSGYKIWYFSHIGNSTTGGITGSILSLLVTGCPACSITLASYIGLGGILSVFPYFGYEVRVIWLGVLIYAIYQVYNSLETCERSVR